ncbi:MAG: phosphatidate cytidylyltransferase [Schaedlerella sp.]|nr:phosphatidate cytidylyltransferase [Schaedlerella sp.]
MFKTRLLSGILLVIIALFTVISGGPILFATIAAISLIGMNELYKVFKIEKKATGICGYFIAILYFAVIYVKTTGMVEEAAALTMLMGIIMVFVIALMAIMVFGYPKHHPSEIMAAFFGVFYVAVMLSYVYQTRMLPQDGIFTVWLVFVCSWGCDTMAYCVGVLFGKHKMAPVLSPKKSIEGGVGGVVGAALIGVLYALAINKWGGAGVDVLSYAIIGAVGGAISQVGDLSASAIKRQCGIKDYGTLIPGHGGILDRFDSVIFTAPIIYYLAILL